MGTPETIDFAHLLAPISEDAPTGVDLRTSGSAEFYALKDACRNARRKESAIQEAPLDEEGVATLPDAAAEWREVFQGAHDVLLAQAKDLEVVAWLIEAGLRLNGFAGLRDGFRLAREMLQTFGDSCYPRTDDGDAFDPFPLKGLNGGDNEGVLLVPIRNQALTQGTTAEPFAFWHYDSAASGKGEIALEDIELAVRETAREFFLVNLADISDAQREFEQLAEAVDGLCGADALPTSHVRNQLTSCLDAFKFLGVSEQEADAVAEEIASSQSVAGSVSAQSADPPIGAVTTREEALRTITELAAFFRRTEPHSPLSYALERIVRWGRTPLPRLLEELIDEDQVRASLFRVTGIAQEPGAEHNDDQGDAE